MNFVEGVRDCPRTEFEIKMELARVDNTIKEEIRSRLDWKSSISETGKNFFRVKKDPVGTIFKVIFLVFVGYISYLLIRGIFAGIEVDLDNNFLDLFSRNATIRLEAGLNLTNGDQAGQFMIDLGLLWYGTYRICVKKPYNKFVCKTVNSVYNSKINELLSYNKKEEANLLYRDLRRNLKKYNQHPKIAIGNDLPITLAL